MKQMPSRDWAGMAKRVWARGGSSARCLLGIATVGAATILALWLGGRHDLTNTVIGYLFVIALVSMGFGYRSAVLAAVTSALCFDYFFLPPYGTLNINTGRDWATELSMFGVAVFVSTLNERLRRQACEARLSERRMESLYGLVKDLADAHSMSDLLTVGVRQIESAAAVAARILPLDGKNGFRFVFSAHGQGDPTDDDLISVTWVADHLEPAGRGMRDLSEAEDCFLPLLAERGCVGVLAIRPLEITSDADLRPSSLLQTMARQMAMAIERILLSEEKRAAEIEAETEQIRNAVLSSVSHDLRTPLTVITSASSTLVEHGNRLKSPVRAEMSRLIYEEAQRLGALLKSLLDVTRLQAGRLRVNRDWESLEEVVASVLRHVDARTGQAKWRLRTYLAGDLPPVEIDAVLIEQVLLNLVDNALSHAKTDLPIEISISVHDGNAVLIAVTDHGKGIRDDELMLIFDKFYRTHGDSGSGLGLGLTLAKGIVASHGGKIWATPTPGGGLTVQFTLPITTNLDEVAIEGERARAR